MKIGLFTPYLQTMGGGERYMFTVAEFFLKRGDTVDFFSKEDLDISEIQERFALDLCGVNVVPDVFFGTNCQFKKMLATSKYDLIFYLSDGSLPICFSKKTIIHFQIPFSKKVALNLANKIKLMGISDIVCNSAYTKKHIDGAFRMDSKVIFPPVDVEKFQAKKKENIILSVGRFFSPLHPKKQEILVREFVAMYKNGLRNYRLVLVGGVTIENFSEVTKLRKKSTGYPVSIIPNAKFGELQDYYAKAKIYWHAAGYGENLEENPQRAEHFGISTVEAMAAGCVPIVFAGGGQKEIVIEGKNGYLWSTTEELKEKTLTVIKDTKLWQEMSTAAIEHSVTFGKERFFEEMEKLVGS
jgi:glycosyltransferase involved in cell wall biosynthesis